jgi:hypothetical protein
MRRDWLKPIASGVLCAALACCAARGEDKTFTSKELGCEVTFPEGWSAFPKRWSPAMLPLLVTFEPSNAGSSEVARGAVYISDLKEGEGLRSFFDNTSNKNWLSGGRVTELKLCKLSGRIAFKLQVAKTEIIAFKSGEFRRELTISVYYVVDGGHGYAICFTSDNDRYVREFEAIAESFKLLKTK